MKGILLAGGRGSRLGPLTRAINKHLLPVFDKPLVHYSLSTLLLAGVREVAIVSSRDHVSQLELTLGSGDELGVSFSYVVQHEPKGIADGLAVCADFLAGDRCALVLGDNVLFGPGLGTSLAGIPEDGQAHIFAQTVSDPRPYAVVSLSGQGLPIDLIEKPTEPRSNLAVPGLYWLPSDAPSLAQSLAPSDRGEIEITDLNREYLRRSKLVVHHLPRGSFWIDAGTPDSLLVASNFVKTVQERQGLMVSYLPEISWRQGWIRDEDFLTLAEQSSMRDYAMALIDRAGA
jgi:glucose-1-phosphate thymidylyltransferase